MESAGVIIFKIDEAGLDECLTLMLQVTGEPKSKVRSADERATDLMRLSRIISSQYGYVPFYHDKNRSSASVAGSTWIFPVPSDALRDHCAAMGTRAIDGVVKEVIHG